MVSKRTARRLVGETMREVGILVFVFFPLDAFFQAERPTAVTVTAVLSPALLFIVVGIIFEAGE